MLTFLGIGAQKCGTTWLYEQLKRHPELHFPAGKEVHFWDREYGRGRSVASYAALFSAPGRLEGEITPAYAILPPEVIAEVHRHFPALRLIYITRNPIDRAWSAALMEMGRARMHYEETDDAWFIDQFRSEASLARGRYRQCIANWRRCYDAEQLLLLSFTDIAVRPRALLEDCARHLGVSPDGFGDDDAPLQKKIFAGRPHPLRPRLREVLTELYPEA